MTIKDCINTIDSKKYTDTKLQSYPTITEMNTAIETAIADIPIPTGSGSTLYRIPFESVEQFNSIRSNFIDLETMKLSKPVIIQMGLNKTEILPDGVPVGESSLKFQNNDNIIIVDGSSYELQKDVFECFIYQFFDNETSYISGTMYHITGFNNINPEPVTLPRGMVIMYYIDNVQDIPTNNSESGNGGSGNDEPGSGDSDNGR